MKTAIRSPLRVQSFNDSTQKSLEDSSSDHSFTQSAERVTPPSAFSLYEQTLSAIPSLFLPPLLDSTFSLDGGFRHLPQSTQQLSPASSPRGVDDSVAIRPPPPAPAVSVSAVPDSVLSDWDRVFSATQERHRTISQLLSTCVSSDAHTLASVRQAHQALQNAF